MPKINKDLTLTTLSIASVIRSRKWNNSEIQPWSLLEWAGAMCVEAGECANSAKKIKCIDCNINNIPIEKRTQNTKEELLKEVAKEAADTILYAILVIENAGFDAGQTIREVFNKKSEEYGFSETI